MTLGCQCHSAGHKSTESSGTVVAAIEALIHLMTQMHSQRLLTVNQVHHKRCEIFHVLHSTRKGVRIMKRILFITITITAIHLSPSIVIIEQNPEHTRQLTHKELKVSAEQYKVTVKASNYGDLVIDNIDEICADVGPELQKLSDDTLITILGEPDLSNDAKFILAACWIRLHPNASEVLCKKLESDVRKVTSSPATTAFQDGIGGAAGDFPAHFPVRSHLRFVKFPSSSADLAHNLVCSWYETIDGKSLTDRSVRNRCFWYIDDISSAKNSNAYFLRRIERGWLVEK
jgi:hypothetical protein